MSQPPRRVVTGLDADGRSCVIIDGPSPVTVWSTDRSPASNAGAQDTGGHFFGFDIPQGGTRLFWTEFAPDGTTGAMGMHATDTLDYAVIISGHVTLITEGGETRLGPGDIVVDRGVNHAWRNDGPEPCRAVFTFVAAEPVGAGATVTGRLF
jgi:mannose-6-phosphate isomerase-like protein (cupin superfamily)